MADWDEIAGQASNDEGGRHIVISSGTKAIVISSGTKAIVISSGTKAIVISSGTKAIVISSGTKWRREISQLNRCKDFTTRYARSK